MNKVTTLSRIPIRKLVKVINIQKSGPFQALLLTFRFLIDVHMYEVGLNPAASISTEGCSAFNQSIKVEQEQEIAYIRIVAGDI